MWMEVSEPGLWLEFTRDGMTRDKQVVQHESSPTERRFDVRDGDVVRAVRLVVKGKRGYAVMAQPAGTGDSDRMIRSFRAN